MIKQDELRQRSNVLFRKAIIDRERLKAFRLNLFVQNQRQNSQQQQNHSQFIAPSFARTQQQSAQTRQQTSVPYGAVTQQQNVQPQTARRVASMASVNTIAAMAAVNNDKNTRQRTGDLRQKQTANLDLENKAARFALFRLYAMLSFSTWKNNHKADIVFVKRENKNGAYFLTFEKDAARTAKVMGTRPKQLQFHKQNLQFVSIPENRMATVIDELAKRDLETKIINSKGQNVPVKRQQTPSTSLSVNIPKPTVQPKIDAVNSLDKNRQETRRTAIHVESLSVTADTKGNWKVSGIVNGMPVTARSIDKDDAVNYKKGEMTKEQLVEKYNLHVPPKQETKVTRKNNMTRRYSLDNK